MVRWIFVFLASIASAASAEDSWTAPELVADNLVLAAALEHNEKLRFEGMLVSGPYGDGRLSYHAPTDFWEAVLSEDSEGLVDGSAPTRDFGLMGLPPVNVLFPTVEGVADIRERGFGYWPEDWESDEKSVWVVGLHKLNPANSHYPEVFFIIFKIDAENGEQPGICHARQVVRVLYTGEANDVELSNCLKAQSTK